MSGTVVNQISDVFPYYTLNFAQSSSPGYAFQLRIHADAASDPEANPDGWTATLEGYLTQIAEFIATISGIEAFTGTPALKKTDASTSNVWVHS